MYIRIYIIIFLNLIGVYSFSQEKSSSRVELNKIQESYLKYKSISFRVDVLGYENAYDKTPLLLGKGISNKSPNFNYSSFTETECLQKKMFTVYINHAAKIIDCYAYPEKKSPKMAKMDFSTLIDSLWKGKDTVLVYKGISEGKKHFTIQSPGQEIKQTDLFFNTISNLLEKVIYYYTTTSPNYQSEFSSVILTYKDYVVSSKESIDKYSFDKYVTKDKSGYKAALAYKNYSVQFHDMTKKSNSE
jgi:hypothetical protein